MAAPPPASLASLCAYGGESDEEVERAARHGGRVRGFPHAAGSFAVHLYLPLGDALPPRLAAFVSAACRAYGGGDGGAVAAACLAPLPGPPHLSLSRCVPVAGLQSALALAESLRAALQRCPPPAGLRLGGGLGGGFEETSPAGCRAAGGVCALVNDTRTRTFLALEADAPAGCALLRALGAADAAFAAEGLAPYYRPPRLHVSLAAALGNRAAEVGAAAAAAVAAGAAPAGGLDWLVVPRRAVLLIGQREHTVWAA